MNAPNSNANDKSSRPNILLIVSDDQGYADVGFHGCKDIPTPHLDGLARAGAVCSSGYVSHPFCSPARAGLITGRYQHRFGHETNPIYNPNDHVQGLPLSEKLLPQFLGEAGYKTGWIGKWHLGAAPEFRPENRGFAETFGFIGGGHRFLNWEVDERNEYTLPIERNGVAEPVTEHLTAVFGSEAASFVTRNADEPWFLYLAFHAPHLPHEPTPERLAQFGHIEEINRRKYAAQVSLMDDAIGETLQALRDSGQQDDTLVFFFSDNGGAVLHNSSINSPLRGGKDDLYEGGVRVPFVVSFPSQLPAAQTYDLPVSALDVFATSLAVAGVPMPTDRQYDSVNLIPYLSGENQSEPHDQLFWRTANDIWATRWKNSKLVRLGETTDELYDLETDIGETTDIQSTHREQARRLAATLEAWDDELVPPAFLGDGFEQEKPMEPES